MDHHLIIIVLIIIYMTSQFHSTFITLVIKTVHDVYFIILNNLLYTYNLYNYILVISINQSILILKHSEKL